MECTTTHHSLENRTGSKRNGEARHNKPGGNRVPWTPISLYGWGVCGVLFCRVVLANGILSFSTPPFLCVMACEPLHNDFFHDPSPLQL